MIINALGINYFVQMANMLTMLKMPEIRIRYGATRKYATHEDSSRRKYEDGIHRQNYTDLGKPIC
jgi:hypothetical protein